MTNEPINFNNASEADYDSLNRFEQAPDDIPNSQIALDVAEYIIAGVLEAGPDNGVEPHFIKDLDKALTLLQRFHHSLTGDNPYYFPTS